MKSSWQRCKVAARGDIEMPDNRRGADRTVDH
jgi:hypothetical protein